MERGRQYQLDPISRAVCEGLMAEDSLHVIAARVGRSYHQVRDLKRDLQKPFADLWDNDQKE